MGWNPLPPPPPYVRLTFGYQNRFVSLPLLYVCETGQKIYFDVSVNECWARSVPDLPFEFPKYHLFDNFVENIGIQILATMRKEVGKTEYELGSTWQIIKPFTDRSSNKTTNWLLLILLCVNCTRGGGGGQLPVKAKPDTCVSPVYR